MNLENDTCAYDSRENDSRAYLICSSVGYLHEEIKYIETTFAKVNNYPKYVINQLNREVTLKHK